MGGTDGPSTHRAARHLSRCSHSTLAATTRRYQRVCVKRIPGTRGLTVSLDEGGQ
jgi:hypothetical protein